MPLREALQTILTDYVEARSKPFAGHSLADFIRHGAAEAVKDALGELGAGLLVEGSAGAGNWATVPWISVFDPAITTSATRGYCILTIFFLIASKWRKHPAQIVYSPLDEHSNWS